MDAVDFVMNITTRDLIGSLAQLLVAIGVFGNMILSWVNNRKIKEVHDATNSMKDELVASTQKAGESKGREDERREARERNGDQTNK